MAEEYSVSLAHFVCADCRRDWWLDARQRADYLRVYASVDCPYCSTRADYAYGFVDAELRETRV